MSSKAEFDVIVCGSLHLDIVVKAQALPQIDETAVGSSWAQVCGGKGGNQAVQAARAGARTAMIGRIGADAFGESLRANLVAEAVDVSCLTVDPVAGSGMSVAILQDDGDYGAVIVSGSNLSIDVTLLADQWSRLGGGKVVVLQNEIPEPVNRTIAALARSAGSRVVLNAAPARSLAGDFLDLVDILIVNRVEAEAMSGLAVGNRAEARAALPLLTGQKRSVIITLGGEGLVLGQASGTVLEIEPVPVQVTSTHGAGDCFVGALSAQLAQGNTLEAACQAANVIAARFVSRTH